MCHEMSKYDRVFEAAQEQPLSRSLPKVLRLATTAGDTDLADWTKLELLGYQHGNPAGTEKTIVPEYRSVPGSWFDAYGRVLQIADPKLSFLNWIRLRSGVLELEELVGAKGDLAISLPEFAETIQKELKFDANTFRISPTSIRSVLAYIKAQLLIRLDQHREQYGEAVEKLPVSEEEILELKPSFWGLGINLRALYRRWFPKA